MTSTRNEPSQDVPIFLRKTYAMIESCDTAICGWSDDGTTFTVKDPNAFETTIIPQFFKHSKFSSFVRQLNFYSFRKIKYGDSIRIDLETEKKTANYWRFRHDFFQRGRPDLLTQIKRMNGKSTAKPAAGAGATPSAVASAASVKKQGAATVPDKSEVLVLKKRIEEMTKNMDKLTEMVQKVSLKQEIAEAVPEPKRKKSVESQALDVLMPDVQFSAMENAEKMEEEIASLPLPIPSGEAPLTVAESFPLSRESSDNEFVDQLFSAFNGDEEVFPVDLLQDGEQTDNRPDPELMQRLSDALELLPKDIQEMIVTRLITAITSSDGFDLSSPAAAATTTVVEPKKIAGAPPAAAEEVKEPLQSQQQQSPLPLAAATLAALLHHYSNQIKEGAPSKKLQKSIPVIPVHA